MLRVLKNILNTNLTYNYDIILSKWGVHMRLLVVEDEIDLLDAITDGLCLDGYAVDKASNGVYALEMALIENYDLIILDLNLPKMDGFEVLNEIRKNNKDVKILILSAKTSIDDKIYGLDNGANDYLTKPFNFKELEARIRNLLRRNFITNQNILIFDKLKLDLSKKNVAINNKEIHLTKKEFSILEYLLLNQNKIISQEELIEHIWDQNSNFFSSSIRVHIASLRKKLKLVLKYNIINTKIGIGYYISKKETVK